MKIAIITTGGTIDKIYFDAKSDYHVGDPQIKVILDKVGATFEYSVSEVFQKDSLDITDEDRLLIANRILQTDASSFIVTHGMDTIIETANVLKQHLSRKTIVLVGSLTPARFRETDAEFNIGVAVGAVQALPEGVYIAMNGQIFNPDSVRKNRAENRFEEL